LKVVFTTQTNGGDIVYKETSIPNISFGDVMPLIGSGTTNYNFSSSTHQPFNPEVVILATDISLTSRLLVGVLASDGPSTLTAFQSSGPGIMNELNAIPNSKLSDNETETFKVIPTLVKRGMRVTISTNLTQAIDLGFTDSNGRTVYTSRFVGTTYVDTKKMTPGLYYIILREKNNIKTKKIMILD
jgi:hypothetical protein